MSSISDIKLRLKNIDQTRKITKAMYLISSIKLNKVKKELSDTKIFFNKINETLYDIITKSNGMESIYLDNKIKKNSEKKKAYLVFIGDNGLAGDYNYNIIKAVEEYVKNKDNSILMIAGYMGKAQLEAKKYNIDKSFDFFVHNPNLQRAQDITNKLIQMYLNNPIDEIYIIHNEMINSFKRKVRLTKILPLDIDSLKNEIKLDGMDNIKSDFIYEPSFNVVFNNIIPLYLKGIIYSLLIEAYACEQSARIFAMDSATKSAEKIIKRLKISYNKERQTKITEELNELISTLKL